MFRRFFSTLWHALKAPWVPALVLVLLLVLLVWAVGPLVAIAGNSPLESVTARLIATVCLIVCWGLYVVVKGTVRRHRDELSTPDKAEDQRKEEQERDRLSETLANIKEYLKAAVKITTTSNFYGSKSRSRYVLPWYLLLGSSNCGKTSVLLNSGLKFPLNEQADRHLYQLKATEQCEVLYGNNAVFLDIPGGYTESRLSSPAHTAWNYLLRRLFKVRPARPLNGIIVCVSMRDIMDSDAARREHLARTLRVRLSEALKQLHTVVPVYLVFTKCDAVPGFAQFFAHLSRTEREQIFGCPAGEESMPPGLVRQEIKALMQTLNAQIVTKIHQERDGVARGDMFRFPQELASLGPRMEDFITEAFGPSRYHRPVLFRGFFFTSALSAHDIIAATAREGELSYQTGFQAISGDYAKGFFLLRLLEGFIIPEARLADTDKEQVWPQRIKRYGVQAVAAAMFFVLAGLLGVSFVNNYSRMEELSKMQAVFADTRQRTSVITDARVVLPELAVVRKTTSIYDPHEDSTFTYGLGLYQGDNFFRATHVAYHGDLNERLMPSVRAAAALRVEQSLSNITELKSALQAYLMLCQPKHIRRKFIEEYLERMWSQQYVGQAQIQAELSRHMSYLLTHGIVPTEPDAQLVEKARKALLRVPWAELVYQRMREEVQESGKPAFTFRGSIGQSPFSGDTTPISHLYTREGYEEYLIRRCPMIIRDITGESWIFGSSPIMLSALDVNNVHKEVRAMYFRDYTNSWSQAVKNLKVRMPATVDDSRKLAEELTGSMSPVMLVLREVRTNTQLIIENVEPDAVQVAAKEEGKRKLQQKLAPKMGGKLAAAVTGKATESAGDLYRRAIEAAQRDAQAIRQYFVPLDSLLDAQGNPGPALQATHDAMRSTGEYFAALLASDNRDQRILTALVDLADEKNDVLRRTEGAVERLPLPVRAWYGTVVPGGLRGMLNNTARTINQNYQERVFHVYERNLRSRYPFSADAGADANPEDFAAFFRSGGILDNFHDSYLRPFISRAGTLQPIMGHYLPVSSAAVVQLQRANRVQEAFFLSGRELGISFLMEPHALDPTLKQVSIGASGKRINYWHGPVQGASFGWPEEGGRTAQAMLETVNLHGVSSQSVTRGEWALFRLLRAGTIKRQEGNTCLIELQHQGKWAQFLIQFRNKVNPFDPKVCTFNLPESLL